jgi:hypothetical protein
VASPVSIADADVEAAPVSEASEAETAPEPAGLLEETPSPAHPTPPTEAAVTHSQRPRETRAERRARQKSTVSSPKTPRRPSVVGKMGRTISKSFGAILNNLLPEPDAEASPRETIPLNIVALIAIFIPALIAVIVVGFSISDQGQTRFEQLRQDALNAYNEAVEYSSVPAADPKTARQLWDISRRQSLLALRENPEDSRLTEIFRESQQKLDFYDRIRRVPVIRLRDFGENADLRGPILANGVDLYTLDRNRSEVYRDTLNALGTEIIGSERSPVIERGQPIREHIVTNLVDILWMNEGGAADRNALVALDENGLLISYSPVFPPANALKLITPPDWRRPVAIASWGANFYVLDAGANQIWRYVPVSGFYSEAPSEYFVGENRPDLSAAVDFSIDDQGAVYVLYQDGRIDRFISGARESFSYADAPIEGLRNTRALYYDSNPVSYALYVAAQGNEALYQISLGGRINDGYRPSTAPLDLFRSITGVFVDSSRNSLNIYVLAGSSLYYLQGN